MFGTTSLLWNASRTVDGRLSAIQVFRTGAFGARPYLFEPPFEFGFSAQSGPSALHRCLATVGSLFQT